MKVAMLATIGERCGIAAYTRDLVAGLRALPNVSVDVVPIREGRQPVEHYREQAERLNAEDVDVVHIQHEYGFWGGILPDSILFPKTGGPFWELRYLLDKPVVITAHTTSTVAELLHVATEKRPHRWLGKQLLIHNRRYRESVEAAPFVTAATIVHTEAARRLLIDRGVKPAYIVSLPAGIPEPLPTSADGAAFRRKFGLDGRRLLTVFGYVNPYKGYELTLHVLPELPQDVALVIAGGPRTADSEPYAAGLQEQIQRSGSAGRVVVTGYLNEEDVAEAMAASEIVLVPHLEATGSYSVTYPLAYGKPILASDQDCFKEIAERGKCIELFRTGDAADYRRQLSGLLTDDARRLQLAEAASRYARANTWVRVARRTIDVYRIAMSAFGDRSPARIGIS